jgi:methylmalonyl-CoA mutase
MPETLADSHALSFDEFEPPTYDAWLQAAQETLAGAPLDKLTTRLYEGLVLQPLYRRTDVEHLNHPLTLPGLTPYVRGAQAAGYSQRPWRISQPISGSTPQTFNKALHQALDQGQNVIHLKLADPESGDSPNTHLILASLEDLIQALDGVVLTEYSFYLDAGASALPAAALIAAAFHQRNLPLTYLKGQISCDPLGNLAASGNLPITLKEAYTEMALLMQWAAAEAPELAVCAVSTAHYHDSGAHTVHELALALAVGVEYLRQFSQHGLDVHITAPRMGFEFAIGSQFFVEVAKLRAARLLWSQIIQAFGGDEQAQRMNLRARTGQLNKTVYDAHNNILRTTMETLAGVLGGADQIEVVPFDSVTGSTGEQAERIARNQQLILQHEAHLLTPVDPAGGSWYIEWLTDQLARHAWSLFREIERQGGIVSAIGSGFVHAQITQTADQRRQNTALRRDVLVGINMYPHSAESADTAVRHDTPDSHPHKPLHPGSSNRPNHLLDKLRAAAPDQRMTAAIEAASAGATLSDITQAWRHTYSGGAEQIEPLPAFRLAAAFEALRQNAAAYEQKTGARPQIFLANFGDYRTRAEFVTGFFQVGGFEVLNHGACESPEAAAQAALQANAPAVIICSTDDHYPAVVAPLVQAIKSAKPETIVILAGYPQDQLEAHRAAGVDDFVHIRANCYALNLTLQQKLGVSQ